MQNIMVKNRSGKLEPLDVKKIQKKTFKSTFGLENVSQSDIETDMGLQLTNGVNTQDIQNTLVMTAVSKIDIDAPNWTFVASRLFIEDLYHKVAKVIPGKKGEPYPHLKDYLEYGSKIRLNRGFWKMYSEEELSELNNKIQSGIKDINGDKYHERDYLFNYLGIKTWFDRYSLKDESGHVFELPQHMFMAISMFLAQREDNKLEWALKFYDMISSFEVMFATPTLSNARKERSQLSSCFVGATGDNIESIFDSYKNMALLSKFGGGIGWDFTDIRSIGGEIDQNKGVAGGTVPWLKITNDIAIAVDQLGVRKGSIAVYLEPWHIDIHDFLDLKKNSGEERRRAHDLFPALWIPDLFMQRVQEDSTWTLFDPYDTPDLHSLHSEAFEKKYIEYENNPNIRKEVIQAKDLWKKVLLSYFESASPFLTFKDEANRRNQNDHVGTIRSSNLCLEIFQNTSAALYGISLELENGITCIYTEKEEVEIYINGGDSFFKEAKRVNNSDILLIDGEPVYINFVSRVVVTEAQTAVCNLASVNLSKIHTEIDMKRVIPTAVRALDNVIDLNLYPIREAKNTNSRTRAIGLGVMGEAQMLAENKIYFGSEEHFKIIDEIMEVFSYETVNASADLAIEKGSYPDYEGSRWSKGILHIDSMNQKAIDLTGYSYNKEKWEPLREKIKKTGIRNGYLMAIAPTSTISILTGTSQAIEPIYKKKWFEENLSGLIPVVAPGLNPDTWAYYESAYDVDQFKLIAAAAIRQKWIDQGQSLNIFITLDKASGKYLHEIYTLAWQLGLKSTYYLRSQSPEMSGDVEDRSMECIGCQ